MYKVYSKDYSKENWPSKAFFIHEMAHVWQCQLKVLNPAIAAIKENFRFGFNYSKAYLYFLDEKKDLTDYRLEQQASIIEEYYLYHILKRSPYVPKMKNTITDAMGKQLFLKVLRQFIKNPSYAKKK